MKTQSAMSSATFDSMSRTHPSVFIVSLPARSIATSAPAIHTRCVKEVEGGEVCARFGIVPFLFVVIHLESSACWGAKQDRCL